MEGAILSPLIFFINWSNPRPALYMNKSYRITCFRCVNTHSQPTHPAPRVSTKLHCPSSLFCTPSFTTCTKSIVRVLGLVIAWSYLTLSCFLYYTSQWHHSVFVFLILIWPFCFNQFSAGWIQFTELIEFSGCSSNF